MKKIKHICAMALTLCALLCWPASSGSCSGTYELTADQMLTLQSNLTQLQQNNERLKNLLTASTEDLTTAAGQSTELRQQLAVLRNQLTESQNQLTALRQQLTSLQSETANARTSLQTANAELQKASESYKAYKLEQEKVQGQLRQQKTLWQILAGGAVIWAVNK